MPTPAEVEKAGRETIQCYVEKTGARVEDISFKFDSETGSAEFDRTDMGSEADRAWDDCYNTFFARPVEQYGQRPEVRRRTEAFNTEFWKLKIACMERLGHQAPPGAREKPDPKLAEAFMESAREDWERCSTEAGDKLLEARGD